MDDNNAQLCLTHAQFAPVGKTRFQRQGSYKSIQEENTYYHKLVRTRLMIASQRQQSDPETQGMGLVLFSWCMIDSTDAGETSFKDEDHRKKVLDNQIIMCLLINALLKEH